MTRGNWHNAVAGALLAVVLLGVPSPGTAASPSRFAGSIAGIVTDGGGVPQMGATVLLFDRLHRMQQKVTTDENGRFSFASLLPDIYSLRVTLATFVPAFKEQILVQPGMRSLLNVSLASLFSSIQLVYPDPGQRALMTEEWKWTLRSTPLTRPVLRLLPTLEPVRPRAQRASAVFSDTHGMVRVSAGDGGFTSGLGNEADLGTAFALATSLYGAAQVQFAGRVGYGANSGLPATAFRTSFSRQAGAGSPEVSVTMRQMFLPARAGTALVGTQGNMPALRSMSLSFEDQSQVGDGIAVQYGFSLDSVSFLDRLNYFSPFARVAWSVGDNGVLDFAYTSGNARPDLAGFGGPDADLQREINALSLFPRVSLRGGRARVQRGENFEVGYTLRTDARTYRVSAYREAVKNAALTMAAPAGVYGNGDLLPDLFSSSSTFNAGDYQTVGYTASVTQNFGENLSATLVYGSIGALTAERRELVSRDPNELRAMIRAGRRHAATLRANARVPGAGTHLAASYQWTDRNWLAPGHPYSTQNVRPEPGWNLYIRQPIPGFPILPWRLEATADLRNLLAEGYLPISMADGRRLVLVQMPRSVRGGVNFIF